MKCAICPRECRPDRITSKGICNALQNPAVSKAQLHMWEEPPISGTNGSGTVFFTGCNLKCVYCQNYKISQEFLGREISIDELAEIFLRLAEKDVHNINLVTPGHFVNQIAEAIPLARNKGLKIPIVYNTNSYEKIESLKKLEGLIDVYLPDLKYYDSLYSEKYSGVKNYFETASAAVLEMVRQTGGVELDENGIIKTGTIIRHLILPGLRQDSKKILDWIKSNISNPTVSLLSQYIPQHRAGEYKEINRKITTFGYDSVVDYFFEIGLENGYVQNKLSASENYIPDFENNLNP